ncbi:ATP-binding protein [Bacillus sp. MUM 116]|uniref:PAS domain-containing sensor histidine kinase n=1 Tax=Bacillus sp. MUM 116 TaxID=1678002 RepID=UPI00210D686D|nr:ATP-binding protein [Bacillus sp. MUM 116]
MEKHVQQKDILPLNEEGNIQKKEKNQTHVGKRITPNNQFLEDFKKLRKSERKFRRIFEDSIDGLLLWNNQYQIVDLNHSTEEIFGLPKERLIGKYLFGLFSQKEIKQDIIKHVEQVLEKGNHSSTIIIETDEGQKRYFDCSSKSDIEGLNFTVIKDVTEKMEIQEQLRKSDTLNVIGELAAGIAHEIRNPMTALKGFIQLLESSIKSEHEMYYHVITSELQRIDSIINEFLILAKPQAIRYQEKDIKQIMKETVDLLNAQAVLHNVQFITVYEDNLPLIFCEPNQLKKVFINIIKNAIEVMPDGGCILIKISLTETNQIRISIRDEGIGIPEEKIKKLGEPFYTTKEQGTGLGLMVSYRIIEEHQGTIQIESEIGKGATFHITLPLMQNS